MDDHWRVLHALPGDGSSGRPARGDALISVQERFNTLSNLQIERHEYGIPSFYADSEVLDFDALQNQTAEPGAHYPARSKPGQSLAAGFFQPAPADVPPDLAEHAAKLMRPVAQFLTGASGTKSRSSHAEVHSNPFPVFQPALAGLSAMYPPIRWNSSSLRTR